MKSHGLTLHLLAATLFLIHGATAGWAQDNARSATTTRAAADNSSLERVLRSAIEADPAQLRRFDRDQNGKLDDDEWRSARQEIQSALGFRRDIVLNPIPAEEQRRLDAVAAEVARRRTLRNKAEETAQVQRDYTPEEIKQREAVAAEVAARRKQRELVGANQATAQILQERAESEAKILVKDLLEIGMAQRKEFDARARAAAEQKQPAETAAKK